MAYFSFTQSIIQGRPIKVFNHGKMQRDFTYIDDIVAGIVAALQQCDGYHLYNLGNHQPESLATFIACIEDALGLKATKEFLPMQAGDVLATYADISDSQRDLGFLPRTRLRDGIQSFVNWYRSHYGSPSLAKC
jgi:UDP-glucuronate 4-epimerase